jgi:hypothetical protein
VAGAILLCLVTDLCALGLSVVTGVSNWAAENSKAVATRVAAGAWSWAEAFAHANSCATTYGNGATTNHCDEQKEKEPCRLRKLTERNFAWNLACDTGENISVRPYGKLGHQPHHVFPVAKEFIGRFSPLGEQQHHPRYGVWWETQSHQANRYKYNGLWTNFFAAFSGELTVPVIEEQGRVALEYFGLEPRY